MCLGMWLPFGYAEYRFMMRSSMSAMLTLAGSMDDLDQIGETDTDRAYVF